MPVAKPRIGHATPTAAHGCGEHRDRDVVGDERVVTLGIDPQSLGVVAVVVDVALAVDPDLRGVAGQFDTWLIPTSITDMAQSALSDAVNESYEPDEQEAMVMDVIRDEGRVNPMLVRQKTGLRKEYVSRAISGLQKAGWVRQVTVDGEPVRGLYDCVGDPRDD